MGKTYKLIEINQRVTLDIDNSILYTNGEIGLSDLIEFIKKYDFYSYPIEEYDDQLEGFTLNGYNLGLKTDVVNNKIIAMIYF